MDLRYCYDEGSEGLEIDNDVPESRGHCFMISGCMNVQTSADLPPGFHQNLPQSIGQLHLYSLLICHSLRVLQVR